MKGALLLGRSMPADTLVPQPGIHLRDHRSSGPFLTLLRYRELLRQLVIRDITLRYKRSVLGFAWTVLNPLFAMAIFMMVFSRVFGGGRHYPLYVVAELLGWNLFSVGSTPEAWKACGA